MSMLLVSCTGSNSFKLEGKMADGSTMNIRIVYAGPDNVNNVLTASREGVFALTGNAPDDGAILEVLDNSYRPLARVFVQNGDKIKLTINPTDATQNSATGNKITEAWMQWRNDNAKILASRNARTINKAIESYVKANPDDVLSTILVVTEYVPSDPIAVAKLLTSIEAAARPSSLVDSYAMTAALGEDGRGVDNLKVAAIPYMADNDSIKTFNPRRHRRSLLVFTGESSGRDTINPQLAKARKEMTDKQRIIEFRMDGDTATWHRNLRKDSISWDAAWVPGSVASSGVERLAVPTLPYFIVADSTGRQLYRGTSVSAALKLMKK